MFVSFKLWYKICSIKNQYREQISVYNCPNKEQKLCSGSGALLWRTFDRTFYELICRNSRELQRYHEMSDIVGVASRHHKHRRQNKLLNVSLCNTKINIYTLIKKSDVEELRTRYEQLLLKIRPNAVGLVDAFDLPDEVLHSTLGSYDGRVYERLMEEAMKSPLNAEPVNQSFHKYLKPFMEGKL